MSSPLWVLLQRSSTSKIAPVSVMVGTGPKPCPSAVAKLLLDCLRDSLSHFEENVNQNLVPLSISRIHSPVIPQDIRRTSLNCYRRPIGWLNGQGRKKFILTYILILSIRSDREILPLWGQMPLV